MTQKSTSTTSNHKPKVSSTTPSHLKEILTYDPEPASCLKDPQYRLTCLFRIFTKSYHEVELKIKENLAQITHLHLEESSSAETRELPKVILFDFENFYIKNKRLFTVTLRSDTVNAEFLVKDVHTELDLVNRFSMYGVLTRLPKTYTLEKRIGKGGFGTVYLAYHLDTAKTVALKIIEKSRIMTDKNYVSGPSFDLEAQKTREIRCQMPG